MEGRQNRRVRNRGGGRRNGAESGAQTYFGVSAKDLSLAQASLLAAVPQNPSRFDPYNVAGHEALITRQHEVLNAMRDINYITQEQADAAKKEPILDTIKPLASQYEGIKAPHFVKWSVPSSKPNLEKPLLVRVD